MGFGGFLGDSVKPWGGLTCNILIFAKQTPGPSTNLQVQCGCEVGAKGGCTEGVRRVQGGCDDARRNRKCP